MLNAFQDCSINRSDLFRIFDTAVLRSSPSFRNANAATCNWAVLVDCVTRFPVSLACVVNEVSDYECFPIFILKIDSFARFNVSYFDGSCETVHSFVFTSMERLSGELHVAELSKERFEGFPLDECYVLHIVKTLKF